jgi:hypothetical protein
MANQFRPLGQASMQAAQQNAALVASFLENNARIRAQQAAQKRSINAEKQMQMMNIAARQQEIAQAAELQAARDARLNEFDLQRIQTLQEKDQANYWFEQTGGKTQAEIAAEAVKLGIPFQAHRDNLIRQRKDEEQRRSIEENYQSAFARSQGTAEGSLSIADRKEIEEIQKLEQGLRNVDSDNSIRADLKPQIKQQIQAEIFRRKTGLSQQPKQQTPEEDLHEKVKEYKGVLFRLDKDGEWKEVRNQSSGNDATSKDVDVFYKDLAVITEEDEDRWLDKMYQDVFSKDINTGVFIEGDEGPRRAKSTKMDAARILPQDREKARKAILAERLNNAPQQAKEVAISKAATRYVMQGLDPDKAREWAVKDWENRGTVLQAKRLAQESEQNKVHYDFNMASGRPMPTSQPSPSERVMPLPANPADLKAGEIYEKDGQRFKFDGQNFNPVGS